MTQPDPTIGPFYRWISTRSSGQLHDDIADRLTTPIAGATTPTLRTTPVLAAQQPMIACEIRASNRGGHIRVFTRNLRLGE